MKRLLALIFAVFPSSSFAGTDMVSFKDPAINRTYGTVVVSVNADLKSKKEAEDKAVKELSKKSPAKFIAETEILSPLKTYTPEETLSALRAHNVEAILFAEVVDARTDTHSVSIPQYGTTYGYVGGQSVSLTGQTGTMNYDYTTSTWKSKIQLVDASSGKVVWMAEAVTDGYTEGGMRNNLIKKTVQESLKANLFPKK